MFCLLVDLVKLSVLAKWLRCVLSLAGSAVYCHRSCLWECLQRAGGRCLQRVGGRWLLPR